MQTWLTYGFLDVKITRVFLTYDLFADPSF